MGISWVARKPIFCEKLWNSPKSAKIPRPHPMKKVKKNEKFSKNFFLLQIERNEEKMNFKQKKIFFFKILTFWYFSKGVPFEKWAKSAKISKNTKKTASAALPRKTYVCIFDFSLENNSLDLILSLPSLGKGLDFILELSVTKIEITQPFQWRTIGKVG